ncbi:MAG: PQQ-dependent sugar dehydrogenase [Chloroflexota bacterium]|nr:PQQ-dependent sugar dehydrogenase [Chloroflexota bacterium]
MKLQAVGSRAGILGFCIVLLLGGCGGQEPTATPVDSAGGTVVAVGAESSGQTAQATSSPEEAAVATSGRDRAPIAEATQTPVPANANTTPTAPQPAARFDPKRVTLRLERFAGELNQPLFVTHAGDGSGRIFAVEKGGTIRTIPNGDLFFDMTDKVLSDGSEQGLLGLAFHPRFKENGYFYVNYTDREGNDTVARYTAPGDHREGDTASEQIVLSQEDPAANHNGGMLAFGSDGYLYISFGDGGGAGDTYNNGQNNDTFLAKILRIDVNTGGDRPYSVPPDNPFVDEEGTRPEIWAKGLRNAWRFSFDRETRDLYIADVGQNAWEWVLFQPAGDMDGRNYGWPITEGNHCYEAEECDRTGLTAPVAEYSHDIGQSITGGYVYRGEGSPALRGAYIFGDYVSGVLWTLYRNDAGRWVMTQAMDTDRSISSFGEDEAGELYLTDLQEGAVYTITGRPR